MALQDVIDATKSHLQCIDPLQSGFAPCSALDPLQRGFVPWSTLYPVDKVPVPTSLDLEDIEELGDGPDALADYGEALDGLEEH